MFDINESIHFSLSSIYPNLQKVEFDIIIFNSNVFGNV